MNDRERLEKAFAELRTKGFQAHTRFMCCMSCGLAELPKDTTQWVFWHEQDDVHAFGTNQAWMCYSGNPDESENAWKNYNTLLNPLHLRWGGNGQEIIDVLNRHGFHVVENVECDPTKTLVVLSD